MWVGTPPARSVALPPPLPMRRFTVDEYHSLIDAGVFAEDERFELLEGWIVAKMPRKPSHDATIEWTAEVLRDRLPAGWRVRIRSAITTADSEPEPDLAIVRGAIRDHASHHPGPADVAVVIEVADSTLARDRELKGRLYARAGILVSWIINLVERRVEVLDDPTGPDASPGYRRRLDYGEGDAVPLVVGDRDLGPIAVRDILA